MYEEIENKDFNDPFKQISYNYKALKCGCKSSDLNSLISNLDDKLTLISNPSHIFNYDAVDDPQLTWFISLLNDHHDWQAFTVNGCPDGLLIIRNLFKSTYLDTLYQQLLFDLPRQHAQALKSNENLSKIQHYSDQELIKSNLRWITFGYHYDWTDKVYRHDDLDQVPEFLNKLLNDLSKLFQFSAHLEAGIVNYYTCKSRLNPHSDNREANTNAPLFSLSLGQPALFLLGTLQRYQSPVIPLLLRNGDLMIMNGSSRLAYHSMNRLICDQDNCDRKTIKRININARQVF